ncbi:hypothetical protein GCK72_007328 [Caenorhabditis remanei]|uniref:Tudor-knot domain-containing protein n=1 Tax=Caenorhabditis remanei TaxID=31234 RepID=A0A6A5HIW1_CAERE|nr:hypothetical protein GCK72_007328 [Caenorhabditis remanei]KAF1767369.1 hypothetical protein GCK72_007328 [Caenorhabditis remanei]
MAAAPNPIFAPGHQFVCTFGLHPVEATVLRIVEKDGIICYNVRFGTNPRKQVVEDQILRFDSQRILNMTWAELKEMRRQAAVPVEEERPRFAIGENCFCMHDGTRYRAKIVGVQEVEGRRHVMVHYVGYNRRHDEKIPEDSPRLMSA